MQTSDSISALDDKQLINRIARARDKRALSELYDRYRHGLGAFLKRKVYQDKLVDEIYNDVMLTVWQKADGFRGDSKVSTWIFGVAYRICMTHARKEMKHTRKMVDVELDDRPVETEKLDQQSDRVDQLRIATAKLKDKHREVIELTYFNGYSLAETAVIIGCPENTVKTRLFHARKNLKISIEQQTVA